MAEEGLLSANTYPKRVLSGGILTNFNRYDMLFDKANYALKLASAGFLAYLPRAEKVPMPSEMAAFAFTPPELVALARQSLRGLFLLKANHPQGEKALVATACKEAMGRPLKYLVRQRLTKNSEKGKGWESYWLALNAPSLHTSPIASAVGPRPLRSLFMRGLSLLWGRPLFITQFRYLLTQNGVFSAQATWMN